MRLCWGRPRLGHGESLGGDSSWNHSYAVLKKYMAAQLTHRRIPLSTTSSSSIYCALFRPPTPTPLSPFVVFVNGLLTRSCDWELTIYSLIALASPPFILSYDRLGVPPSDPLPTDRATNDISTAARDLGALLEKIYPILSLSSNTPLVLVGSSIGCCIIRLFIEYYAVCTTDDDCDGGFKGYRVAGVLFLDSYIANTDFVSLFPPASADEPEALTRTRAIIVRYFHPDVENPEGLSRSNAQELLPSASDPKLPGGPKLTVVSHDPEYNAEDMVLRLDIDKVCYLRYVQSAWDEYNAGLAQLSPNGRGVKAERSGHFIQHDRPDLVMKEIEAVLRNIAQL